MGPNPKDGPDLLSEVDLSPNRSKILLRKWGAKNLEPQVAGGEIPEKEAQEMAVRMILVRA